MHFLTRHEVKPDNLQGWHGLKKKRLYLLNSSEENKNEESIHFTIKYQKLLKKKPKGKKEVIDPVQDS